MKDPRDLEVPTQYCPHCNHLLTAAWSQEGGKPQAGDPTLCIECGVWLFFADAALNVRKATDEELGMLERDESAQLILGAWAKMKQHFGAKIQ